MVGKNAHTIEEPQEDYRNELKVLVVAIVSTGLYAVVYIAGLISVAIPHLMDNVATAKTAIVYIIVGVILASMYARLILRQLDRVFEAKRALRAVTEKQQ